MNQQLHSSSFYAGLSGLQLHIPKYLYPPPFQDASRLTYYASFFNSIEFNSSFYKLPMASTVTKWSASVPENFKFTFKVWKEISHQKGLSFKKSDVQLFLKSVNPAGNKKGCLLIQFPPSLGKENLGQLNNLLSIINKQEKKRWHVAVEFRNKSWYDEEVYDLIDFYNATVVIHDIPKSATPLINHPSDFIYIRFHGPTGNYRDSYPDDFLSEYSGYIHEWLRKRKTVYAYFNNTMGDALNNLKTLNKLVHANKSSMA